MNQEESYERLKEAFVATFIDELLPGVFHNFANPLNGIMGRAKLMQRRLADFVKKLESKYPDAETELGQDYKKLISDINAINNESERFFEMFQVATAKFYTIGSQSLEKISLSYVLQQELNFADFYLDFKHHLQKEVSLDDDMPYISGVAAFYSMSFWMILRYAMLEIRKKNEQKLLVTTNHDDQFAIASMSIPKSGFSAWWSNGQGKIDDAAGGNFPEERSIGLAFRLLRKIRNDVQINYDETSEVLTIKFMYRN